MTLQRKFTVLIGLLAVTAIVSLATSAWSVMFMQRESGRAFEGAGEVLTGLRSMREDIREIRHSIDHPGDDDRFGAALAAFDASWEQLRAVPALQTRGGVSTTRALAGASEQAADHGRAYIKERSPGIAESLVDSLDRVEAISSIIESEILLEARDAVQNGRTLRSAVFRVLALALLSAVLISVLALILVRRWVIAPVGSLRDATKRIAGGDFEHRLPVQGEDELAQLSAEVNQMSETIVRMQDERVQRERLAATGEMVRRLAHNIRNPLAGIRSLAELSRDDAPSDSDIRENQERIVHSVDRFESWLAELLESTSPLEMQFGEHEIAQWIDSVSATLLAQAAGREVDLSLCTTSAPARAVFDPRHMEHAVVAIGGNAIDAAGRGGRVSLTINDRPEEASWSIDVSDSGDGIPEEVLGSMFDAHFTTKANGNGIGLAVARQVVRAHGGRIDVRARMDKRGDAGECEKGAHFSVVLPKSGLNGSARVVEN